MEAIGSRRATGGHDLSPNGCGVLLRSVVVALVVVVVVWDTVECVCMYTPHNAHVQASR